MIPKYIVEFALSALLLIVASIFDIKTGKIPNWLVVLFAAIAIGSFILSLILLADYTIFYRLILVIAVFLFGALRLIGLGDIKLIMVLALLNHPVTILLAVALACACVVCYALLKNPSQTRLQILSSLEILRTRSTKNATKNFRVPFAPALAIGYCVIGGIQLFYV